MSNRTDTKVEEDVQRLVEWLGKQPHLPHDIDKRILASYARGTKSLEIAKKKLENYFICRSKISYYFTFPGRDPEDPAFKRGCEAMKLFALPKLTPEKYVIVMIIFDMDTSKFSHSQFIARTSMMVDLAMLESTEVEGCMLICDLTGLEASILTKLNLPDNAFFLSWFEKSIPMKMKKMIFLNVPKFMDIIVNLWIKPFLSQKLCDRMLVSTEDISITKNFIPEEMLPCDFGGNERSSTDLNNYWLEQLQENRGWFEKTIHHVADLRKKPPDDKNTYGVNGTFRTLNVD